MKYKRVKQKEAGEGGTSFFREPPLDFKTQVKISLKPSLKFLSTGYHIVYDFFISKT
jgi:hypothetical protein